MHVWCSVSDAAPGGWHFNGTKASSSSSMATNALLWSELSRALGVVRDWSSLRGEVLVVGGRHDGGIDARDFLSDSWY